MKTRKTYSNLLLIAMALITMLTFTQCNKNKVALQVIAKSTNMICPKDFGGGVVMNKVELVGDNELLFYMTVPMLEMVEINDAMKAMAEDQMITALSNEESLEQLKKLKATISYSFRDKQDNEIVRIRIPHEKYAESGKQKKESSAVDILNVMISGMIPNLPMKIDEYTYLVDVKVTEPKNLEYFYELTDDFPQLNEAEVAQVKATVLKNLLNTPQMKGIFDLGANIKYTYKYKSGKLVFALEITPEDYNFKKG